MAPGRDDEIAEAAEVFAEVARQLLREHLVPATLQRIVELAVEHLDACEHAGITIIEGGRISSPASSGDVPRILDEIQAQVGEGPCVDAIREREVFLTGDLTAERRWPQFARRAHDETGVTSILSIRLFVEHDTMGALNLYSRRADAFGATSRREAHLERKAASRDVIGRAKGI